MRRVAQGQPMGVMQEVPQGASRGVSGGGGAT